jgi:hypothetical protein
MSEFEHYYEMPGISAPNSSRGFNPVLIAHIAKYVKTDDYMILVAEPYECAAVMKELWPQLREIDVVPSGGVAGEEFDYDLNVIQTTFEPLYELVVCQATIEHVCMPANAIANCANLCAQGGHLTLMTVAPGFEYHAWPIDCLRFFPDFFKDLERYLPIKMVEYDEYIGRIVVTYEKTS